MQRVLTTVLFGSLLASGLANGLTPGEMTSWKIVCAPDAIESERYAAQEFQTLFEGLTGNLLPIVETAPEDQGAVLIGPGAVAASGTAVDLDDMGEEGLFIDVGERALRICGGRPRGTLYGVYEFFEEYCGVRYLTHDHTHFPSGAVESKLKPGTYTFSPTFAFRWPYYGETNRNPAFAARLRANTVSDEAKFGGRTGYRLVSHNVAYLVPPAEYGETHPEYYALVDGRRRLEMHGGGPQLCMTNPGVLDIVVQAVLDAIEKNPDVRNFNVAHMDNQAYCTCENCAAIDAREESHAGATLAFVNAVAERVEKIHPDVLISTYAYQYTRKPPKNLRACSNVMIQLCSIECCTHHAINDPGCRENRAFCQDMAGWKEKADHIFIWHYNTNFKAYLLPFPNLRSIGPSVAYFAENHGRGVFMQAAGNSFSTELSDLRNYVIARCLWKPGRDSWEEALTFCRLHYAEAAQPVLDYLRYYHGLVSESGQHPGCFPTEASLCINPDSARRIAGYFREAMDLAESDTVRARVEKASLCAYRAMLSAATMDLKYEDGVCRPHLEGAGPDILDRYAQLAARFEVPMDNERTSMGAYLDYMRTLYDGMKAVRVENDLWRVTVLPESNAKVVEMTYKPTGRDILQPARSLDRFRFEEWVRQGEGPKADGILPYESTAEPDQAVFRIETADGATIERTISLRDEAVRFETVMTAAQPRACEFHIHPEYDTGTHSDDPKVLSLYVRAPEWVHANEGWKQARPTEAQTAAIREGAGGGVFAYYNHAEGFGAEQRYDPEDIQRIAHFWSPARREVNLEMFTPVVELDAGQSAAYAYEVRYLDEPPK